MVCTGSPWYLAIWLRSNSTMLARIPAKVSPCTHNNHPSSVWRRRGSRSARWWRWRGNRHARTTKKISWLGKHFWICEFRLSVYVYVKICSNIRSQFLYYPTGWKLWSVNKYSDGQMWLQWRMGLWSYHMWAVNLQRGNLALIDLYIKIDKWSIAIWIVLGSILTIYLGTPTRTSGIFK